MQHIGSLGETNRGEPGATYEQRTVTLSVFWGEVGREVEEDDWGEVWIGLEVVVLEVLEEEEITIFSGNGYMYTRAASASKKDT